MFTQLITQSDMLNGCALIAVASCLAMTDPIWTDETEANYRKWHKERYGVEPPEVNLPEILLTRRQQAVIHKIDNDILNITQKEESMKESETDDNTFIPQPTMDGSRGVTEMIELARMQPGMKENKMGVTNLESINVGEGKQMTITNAANPVEDKGNPLQSSPVKRTRRPKGLPENVTVETIRNAYIDLPILARPEGFNKVFFRLWVPGEKANVGLEIEWPEGKTAIEALTAHFVVEATREETVE